MAVELLKKEAKMQEVAWSLVKKLRDCARRDFCSEDLENFIKSLEQEGLLSVHTGSRKGKYVLRDEVHGSPLLFLFSRGEIQFNSLEFARQCREAWKLVYETSEAPSLLKVIE